MSSEIFNDDFHQLVKHIFLLWTQTDEMKKLRSGFLLKKILNRFSSKFESTLNPDRLLWLYFAHGLFAKFPLSISNVHSIRFCIQLVILSPITDTTIGDMLSSLGLK